jgi:SNF2 family DNA or RNA helicase
MSCIDEKNDEKKVIIDDYKETQKVMWDSFDKVPQPENLNIRLFPHQLVSVYNMENLERVRKISARSSNLIYLTDFGILGDIPGYGKSFSIVSLILRDQMPWDITKMNEKSDIYTVNSSLKVVKKVSQRRVRANLILASSTLIEQWKEYFNFVKPNVLKLKEISNRKDFENFDPNNWDVVLVSSVRYNELVDITPNVVWKRFVFDEAASTHINSMRSISAGFIWFVSATYKELLRCGGTSSHFMRSFFSKIDYFTLDNFVIKNPVEFVKYSFKMPEVHTVNHVCLNPRILNVLSNYIDVETKTMIAAGDFKSAILKLGGGTTSVGTNLVEIVSKKQNEKLMQAKFSLNMWKERSSLSNVSNEISFWEKRVSEIEKNIKDLEEKFKNLLEDDCTICYSMIQDPILIPCCQNVFCGKCIMKWMETNKTCPMCRTNINVKELVYIKKDNSDSDEIEEKKESKQEIVKLSKQDKVFEIVSNGLAQNKKFLIFSMYDESFLIIRRVLDTHNIDFVEISGSKATRDSKIKKFKENKVNVVFLNSRFNGAGINLETATDIILYHEMPQSIKDQVVGRALRIGREQPLTIHNLIY